jgi:uncharacterized phage protein gp47/JayE
MAFERPTFAQLRDRILADLDTEFDGAPYSTALVEYSFACAVAGVALMLYAAIEIAAGNLIPDRAASAIMLRWAAFFGIDIRTPTPNKGPARWVATGGATLPAGTVVRLSDGFEYTVDADVAESGGFVTAALTASVAGSAGRAAADTAIALGSPVAGITPNGIVLAPGLTGGTDTESNRSVLSRLLARLRRPPRGGGPGDYVAWALEVPGVTRAWEYTPYSTPPFAPGSVRVLFVCDDEVDPIPSPAKVAEVQAHIDARRPVTVRDFLALAPVGVPLDVEGEITIEDGFVQATVEAAATTAVRAFIRRESEPGKTISLSRLDEAISTTAGELSHILTEPTGDTVPSTYELVVPGAIVWS